MKKEYLNPETYCTRVQTQAILSASGEAPYSGGDPAGAQAPSRRGAAGEVLI